MERLTEGRSIFQASGRMFRRSLGGMLSSHSGNPPRTEDTGRFTVTKKMRLTLTCEPHFCYCVSFVLKNVEIAGFSSFHPLRFHIICFRTYEPVHCAGF